MMVAFGDWPGSPASTSRYTARPMPPYRHVPGQTAHPTRDPEGHSYGRTDDRETPDLNLQPWRDSAEYLFGIDLFNEGFYWECHEVMEALWHAAGMGSPAGHILQAVIQCAAAHLKTQSENRSGAQHLFAQAEKHVSLAGSTRLGLDLVGMLAETGAFAVGDSPQPARLVLDLP